MIQDWLLIVWVGTTTNLQVLDRYATERACQDAMVLARRDIPTKFTLECSSDLREGRSLLPSRRGQQGLVK